MSADSDGLYKSINQISSLEKENIRKKYNTTNNGLIYLFSGYFITRKGIDHLLVAWEQHIKQYNNDSLILIGDGPLYDRLYKEYSKEKSIYFEGRIPYDQIGKYYAIANVFIMPTIEDNWSLVIPEAMSCGLPVATSIYNGCHTDLIKENINGITFDTFKHDTIINALRYFHHNNLKEMGEQSILIEKKFNVTNSAMRVYLAISQYYNKLIDKNK